jgi:alpha-tubulin suppressor-like RCC1 family protein
MYGQLMIPSDDHNTRANFVKAKIPPGHVKSIYSKFNYTLVLMHDGRIFGCGWNGSDCLGMGTFGKDKQSITDLTQIVSNGMDKRRVIMVGCGGCLVLALTGNTASFFQIIFKMTTNCGDLVATWALLLVFLTMFVITNPH